MKIGSGNVTNGAHDTPPPTMSFLCPISDQLAKASATQAGTPELSLPLPVSFLCPITHRLMCDPVATVDGHVYESRAIEEWFRRHHASSPLTNKALPALHLEAVEPLRVAIQEFLKGRPDVENRPLSQSCIEEAVRLLEEEHQQHKDAQDVQRSRSIAFEGLEKQIARLREAVAAYPEAALRAEVSEVAWELEAMDMAWKLPQGEGERLPCGGPLATNAVGSPVWNKIDNSYSSVERTSTTTGCTTARTETAEPSTSLSLSSPGLPRQCLVTLKGHSGWVYCVVTLGTERVASCFENQTVKVWDVASGRWLKTLKGQGKIVRCVTALGEDRLASGSTDQTAKVWEVATGRCLAKLHGHRGIVLCLAALSADRLASGSWDNTIKVWNVASGACLASLEGHTAAVQCLAPLLADRLASGSLDRTVRVWEASTGACLATLWGHRDAILCLAELSADRLASGSADTTVKIWDVASGECLSTLEIHREVLCIAAIASDRLATGTSDSEVQLWEVASSRCVARLEGHTAGLLCLTALSGGRLASGSEDGTVRIWGP